NNPKEPGGDTIWVGVRDNNTQQGQALVIGDCSSTNLPNSLGGSATAKSGGNLTGFNSFHTGGTNFLLGDGSVRFISNNIDPVTYSNLATIDDGTIIADF